MAINHQTAESVELGPVLSPPRAWPACFKESAKLKNFIGTELKGTRCRLVNTAPAAHLAAEAAAVKLDDVTDSFMAAERLSNELKWRIIKGFAIFEREDSPGVFVAQQRWWNAHTASGIWVDLTPRPEHAQLVLVESGVAPKAGRVIAMLAAADVAAASAAAPAIATPAISTRAAAVVDISDDAAVASAAVAAATAASPATAAAPPAAAAPAVPAPPAPPEVGEPRRREAFPSRGVPRGRTHPMVGMWRSSPGQKPVPTGARGSQYSDKGLRVKHVPFPGSKGQVRLLVHADGTYELEARRWGTVDGLREGREPEMFAPLEYGDKGAATLRVSGSWTERHEPNFKVEKVEQLSNGDAEPPITEKEIHYACGKSLGRPLKAHLPRDTNLLILVKPVSKPFGDRLKAYSKPYQNRLKTVLNPS